MPKPLPLALRLQKAVMESAMPATARHVVHALALSANSSTGVGWHGQATIARVTGLTERTVRSTFAELESRTDWPVRIVRRRRGRAGGAGRSSDEWRLELVAQPETNAGSGAAPQPEPRAASGGGEPVTSTGNSRHLNRKSTTAQPETISGDLPERSSGVNAGVDSASQSSAGTFALSPEEPTQSRRPKPKGEATPDPRVTTLRDTYVEAYRSAKRAEPVFTRGQWSRAMGAFKDLLGATKELEAAQAVIRRAFADSWHCANRCQPWEIVADANKLTGAQPSRQANGQGPRQKNHEGGWSVSQAEEA